MPDQDNVVLDILCCVMVADGKASRCEKAHILELMANYASDKSKEEVGQHIIGFVAEVKSDGFKSVLKRSCTNARSLDNEDLGELVYLCYELADSDSEVDDREKKVIEQIRRQIQRIPGVKKSIKRARQSESPVAEQFTNPEASSQQRIRLIGFLVALCCVVAYAIVHGVVTANLSIDFRQVTVGMTEDQVYEIMGRPLHTPHTDINDASENEWGDLNPHFNYESTFIVKFQNGIVTSKERKQGTYSAH